MNSGVVKKLVARKAEAKKKQKRFPIVRVVLTWVLVLAAWGVASYPGVSMWLNDRQFAEETQDYRSRILDELGNDPTILREEMSSAQDYNDQLSKAFDNREWELEDPWQGATHDGVLSGGQSPLETGSDPYGGVLDFSTGDSTGGDSSSQQPSRGSERGSAPGGGNTHHDSGSTSGDDPSSGDSSHGRVNNDGGNEGYRKYLSTLSNQNELGILTIPSINVKLPIYHGTTDYALFRGVGHVYGTHLPVGGTGTHTAMAGHSGVKDMTMFDHLPDMSIGDMFYIETSGKVLAYKVTRMDTVLPDETDLLKPQPGKDLATLITCVPYRWNTHRLLVTGERVSLYDSPVRAAGESPRGMMGSDSPADAIMVNDSTVVSAQDDTQRDMEDIRRMSELTSDNPVTMHWWSQAIVFSGGFIVLLLAVWTVRLIGKHKQAMKNS